MSFLFKVVTSCSRVSTGRRAADRESHTLLFYCLQFLVYFILAALSLTKKQVVSPTLLESSPFNHSPHVYEGKPGRQVAVCRSCALPFPLL